MTWAQDQRIAFIKERIDAGFKVNRSDLREKFFVSLQTATSTFHEFERRYPGVMRFCGRTKAMVPASWVADTDWKARALAAEAQLDEALRALEPFARIGNQLERYLSMYPDTTLKPLGEDFRRAAEIISRRGENA